MVFSRRKFNQSVLQFLTGTALSFPLSQTLKHPIRQINLTQKLQNFFNYLDPEIELLIPTFLGNDQRRFYGRGVPQGFQELDQFYLGTGVTYVGTTRKVWSGAGWTGQPTLTRDRGKIYLVIGAYDHHLRKIDIANNQEVWRYRYNDVIKGSSTIYVDETASAENRIVILQGSRSGNARDIVPSFRAISFRTGQEIWKLDIKKTPSYSRDNDSSALYLGQGLIFNAGENAIGYFLNSSTLAAKSKSGFLQPEIISEVQLYALKDTQKHGGNLVAESSPSRYQNELFIAAGSGHIYGINIEQKKIVWDFYTGSDIDGSAVISREGKLFCAIEKQYIPGAGGVLKLNPYLAPGDSVEWFLPTGNRQFNSWEGGVIGSVAINDEYNFNKVPAIFATNSIEGILYIGAQNVTTGKTVKGPLKDKDYQTPLILFTAKIGPSISTPIFTDGDQLITATYNGVYRFQLNWEPAKSSDGNSIANYQGEYYRLNVQQIGHFKPGISFEATPIVWDGIIRICGRDGWLYTLG